MDPSALKPDPEHVSWLKDALLIAGGALIASWKTIFRRHEQKEDDHTTLLADLVTRVAVLENRPPYVTLPELRVAIGEAINEAQKLFTPQHAELAREFRDVVKESKKETEEMILECNKTIRRDFSGALDQSTAAVNRAASALEQSSKLMESVVETLRSTGVERRKRK